MGVEHVVVIGAGPDDPTLGHRVPLGLSQRQKAKLKGAYVTVRDLLVAPSRKEFALSEDLKVLTLGLDSPYMDSPKAFAVAHFTTTQATAVGVIIAWMTFKFDLWDFEVYQDIAWVTGVTSSRHRLDLFYEKVLITRLDKASQLHQQKRQFEQG